jgi:hypothetical protein
MKFLNKGALDKEIVTTARKIKNSLFYYKVALLETQEGKNKSP